ncbi:NAD(P)-dependent alcohol dehydrogenase [Agromyces atrinae]|uniref:NAD(P)-dependent alcohol dehydrogenase n=1 Tax=Agromyces atrinae TaxID=592376 RepID=UPI001F5616AC|nr:NAD(P)-dependent alcohol dehydrogenase [Agromyces atrinae]MCI2958469.1 NAD(P)-dependent alcohol dehydrogenase [Agromyces atrinae]
MKAAVIRQYGAPDVVRVEEVPAPAVGANDVLVRVSAVAVTAADSRIRGARFPRGFAPFARLAFGVRRPRRAVLGGSFSGVVDAVGSEVTAFSPGQAVCGTTGMRFGAHAELVTVPASRLVALPAGVGHDDAAGVIFGGLTALHFLRDTVTVRPGDTVLVNGASGAIGTNAVQLAKNAGATVTAVTSTANLDLARRLGADRVVDYTVTPTLTLTDRFDIVLDAVGNISPRRGVTLLSERGTLMLAVADLSETLSLRRRVKSGSGAERAVDVEHLVELLATGRLESVIDSAYPLTQAVRAHERVDSGRKVGNVILNPGD